MMREVLITLIPILLAIGCSSCGPSVQQIRDMATWSSAARATCTHPGQCAEAEACIRGVLRASEPQAGKAEYNTARTACWPYGGSR